MGKKWRGECKKLYIIWIMRVGLLLMRSDQLNTFPFFCPVCFQFKRQFKCVPQEFRHFTFTHFGSFAIPPSPVSLPRVPPIPEWNAVYEASFRIARYPRVITLSQVCSWRPTTTRRSVWNRGWPFKNLPPYFVSRSCDYFWEFVSFHARKSICVPSLRSYGGF